MFAYFRNNFVKEIDRSFDGISVIKSAWYDHCLLGCVAQETSSSEYSDFIDGVIASVAHTDSLHDA